MELKAQHVTKIDPLLQEALAHAEKDEVIRVVLSLDSNAASIETVLRPKDFPSRQAYRQALIEQREQSMSSDLSETLTQLKEFSLQTVSSTISPIVVVEGKAANILSSLELSRVKHASLDRLLGLPELIKPEYVKHVANIYDQLLSTTHNAETKELITKASEQYILKYHREYGRIKILRMLKSVHLENLFTPVQFLDRIDFLRLSPQEILNQNYLKRERRPFTLGKGIKKSDGLAVANQEQYLMVLGSPGAGKSTFLRKVALEALKGGMGSFQHDCFPVLIEMKRLNSEVFDLNKEIETELSSCQFPSTKSFIKQALNQGKFLILLDGLDEIPTSELDNVLRQIKHFADSYKKNRYIISIRKAAWSLSFLQFKYLEIADFDSWQIKDFIHNWFSVETQEESTIAHRCWTLLNEPEHELTLELAKTPLLLTFICIVYEESGDLPQNRASLYGEALDILLRKWWMQRNNDVAFIRNHDDVEPIHQLLGVDLEKSILSEIAYRNQSGGKIVSPRKQLIDQIKHALETNVNAPSGIDAAAVFNAINIQQGVLVERVRDPKNRDLDLYSFSHLTIQEYLASVQISNNHQISELIQNHLTDPKWKEVILLSAGLSVGKLDGFLLMMEEKCRSYLETEKGKANLVPMLQWVEEVTDDSISELSPVGKRFLAVGFAAANAYALSYADSYSRSIRVAFDLAYRSSEDLAYHSAQNLSYSFSLAYCCSLACSYVSPKLFESYSNACRLIYAYALSKSYYHTLSVGLPNLKSYTNAIAEFMSYARTLQGTHIFNSKVNITALISRLENLKSEIPSPSQPSRVHREFSFVILKTWSNAFYIDNLLEGLPRKTLEEIGNQYFYPLWLIVQCKQAGVSVSKETWTAIESRMLKINI